MGWPGYRTTAWHQAAEQFSTNLWIGSLVDGMRDASGQMYMRNRYYDPATGQFTQADPIGLAGGLNAYGFAAGDPISFDDPFGLAVCSDSRQLREATSQAVGATITWGADGCVRDVRNVRFNTRTLDRRQRVFLLMVAAETEHWIRWRGGFFSSNDGKDVWVRPADASAATSTFYWGYRGGACPGFWGTLFGRREYADYHLAGVILHELGHIAGRYEEKGRPYTNREHRKYVFPFENLYHAQKDQVLRCE